MKIVYPVLGLAGEVGEVADKVKKIYRDFEGVFSEENKQKIAGELGDVLWYLTAVAHDLGYSLEDIARSNAGKVVARKANGTLHGEGDNR